MPAPFITTPPNLIRPEVQLTGTDGNALMLIATVARALKRAGNTREVIDTFRAEAMSGGYDHVLRTCMAYAEVT